VFGSDLKSVIKGKISSPLVIFNKPNTSNTSINYDGNTLDVNQVYAIKPTNSLQFNFIATLISANFTKSDTKLVPINLSASLKNKITLGSIMKGVSEFIDDPVGSTGNFIFNNWFVIVLIICFVLVVSLIYANFTGGGGITILNNKTGRD